jgi:hypothetical protein
MSKKKQEFEVLSVTPGRLEKGKDGKSRFVPDAKKKKGKGKKKNPLEIKVKF